MIEYTHKLQKIFYCLIQPVDLFIDIGVELIYR
jgi:hypothetical protein